ncbi:MAG: hypothetical protein ABI835_10180 [Chloroflexota bacterium]
METPLTILYTHNLRGDLDVLPRLYNFQRQLKALYAEDVVPVCADDPASAPGRVLLLDLGESCAAAVWHCAVSGGRSTLVLLDGMGYHAARVSDAPAFRAKMGEGVSMALVDEAHPHVIDDVLITPLPAAGDYTLQIMLTPAETTQLDGNCLYLAALNSSQQIGAAHLAQIVGRWTLTAHEIHDLPRRTLPDPTIAASVDFVLSEARYAQKRHSS